MLIAQGWTQREPGDTSTPGQPPPLLSSRLTLSLAGFAGMPPREVCTVTGYASDDADDLAAQWSPDGSKIAVSTGLYHQAEREGEVGARSRLMILDARTGAQVGHLDDVRLAGSASWSPDSSRLLVSDPMRVLWTYDLDAERRVVLPVLQGARPGSWVNGSQRLLGFADDQRLLVAVQRRGTMTISAVHLRTGDTEGLIRWTGGLDMYPVLAQMPPGYWDQNGP